VYRTPSTRYVCDNTVLINVGIVQLNITYLTGRLCVPILMRRRQYALLRYAIPCERSHPYSAVPGPRLSPYIHKRRTCHAFLSHTTRSTHPLKHAGRGPGTSITHQHMWPHLSARAQHCPFPAAVRRRRILSHPATHGPS